MSHWTGAIIFALAAFGIVAWLWSMGWDELSPPEEALSTLAVSVLALILVAGSLYACAEVMTAPRNYIYYGAPHD